MQAETQTQPQTQAKSQPQAQIPCHGLFCCVFMARSDNKLHCQ